METALTAKQESEARAMTLEEKVKQYEQEITDMKEKVLYDWLMFIKKFGKQKFECSLSTVLKFINFFRLQYICVVF